MLEVRKRRTLSCDSRGLTLGTVLLCMVALALVLFTAGSAAVSHLRFVESAKSGDHARNLAEAALAETLSRLVQDDFAFGRTGTDRVVVTLSDVPGATGEATFDKAESGFTDGYSLNNLNSDSAVTGAGGRQIPGRTMHVVARGRVGSVERWMECIYYRPAFPDGLACTGKVDARSVYLTAVRRASAYSGGDPSGIPYEETLPANIFSNSTTLLTGQSTVSGSVGAVGSVSVAPSCTVRGEILPGSEPRSIPDLRLDEKIAIVEENNSPVSSTGGDLTLEPNFFMKSDGDLSVGGDLDMNGSVLLIKNGDLRVSGGIKGTGIILSEGDVEIRDGRTNLSTAEQVAIGCKGDFKLQAEAPEANYFQGLVYAEGNVEAKDITVVGAVVGNGQRGAAGDVKLDNVRFVYNPGSLEIVAVPPFVAGRRHEASNEWHHAGYSALIRPNADGDGWIIDAWAGLQRKDLGSRQESLTADQLRDIAPATFYEWTQKDIAVSQFGWSPNISGKMLQFYGPWEEGEELAFQHYFGHDAGLKEAVKWLDVKDQLSTVVQPNGDKDTWYDRMTIASDANPNGPEQPDGGKMSAEVFRDYRDAQSSNQASGVIHFNLNNLLAELGSNTSRVMLWRPIDRP
jgi:hypothetical protein